MQSLLFFTVLFIATLDAACYYRVVLSIGSERTYARKGRLADLLDTILFGIDGSGTLFSSLSMYGGGASPPAICVNHDMIAKLEMKKVV